MEEYFAGKYDVAVIGAGHAGVEAALAAARLGVKTCIFTLNLDKIANMPCNPSIGGTAKGHLVREIDALGGEMGRAADAVTLQSRTLNLGKGAAVHSKRIQADRVKYSAHIKHILEKTENLRPLQAEIVEILTTDMGNGEQRISGVVTSLGEVFECDAAIIASGTYLEGRIFVGDRTAEAGPDGMLPSRGLSASLAAAGLSMRRFKTGTPPRILRSSVDFSRLEEQAGEPSPIPFSADTDEAAMADREQIPCHIVYTNAETHRIIKENISRSALFSGLISGVGPRYCPSIEDKIMRFADKERHQLFIEPMGSDTEEMYVQGMSSSLPEDVQCDFIHSIEGLEKASIMRPAYAIEYDAIDARQLKLSLESRIVDGLFCAGQINGSSGYEEAAAQGLMAGINAARKLQAKEPIVIDRSEGYIGVLIDDLVTRGTREPYRMMTSRAEYRLVLRQDNADSRLTPKGYEAGLISEERYGKFKEKMENIRLEIERLNSTFVAPGAKINELLESVGSASLKGSCSLADLLRRPEISYNMLRKYEAEQNSDSIPKELSFREAEQVEISVKYEGYIKRQEMQINQFRKLEKKRLPVPFDYKKVTNICLEAREKLTKIQPESVGQASRITGVSPADITALMIFLSSQENNPEGAE